MKVKDLMELLEDLDPELDLVITRASGNRYLADRAVFDLTIQECKCYNNQLLVDGEDWESDFMEWVLDHNLYYHEKERLGVFGSAPAYRYYVEVEDEIREGFEELLEDIALIELG